MPPRRSPPSPPAASTYEEDPTPSRPRENSSDSTDVDNARQRARERHSTDEWRQRYAIRAGVESTIAQGVKGFGLRRSRYRGTSKTHLQHLLIATAMNLTRIDAWLTGTPPAPTRISHFGALRPAKPADDHIPGARRPTGPPHHAEPC
ncbi:transposase [Nonomuraea purpurea]|uniref:Transposase n=1 Tax=Nonomuraea purpurea TaxID=1849276 RepID=A0ABV8GIB7_9ACTN